MGSFKCMDPHKGIINVCNCVEQNMNVTNESEYNVAGTSGNSTISTNYLNYTNKTNYDYENAYSISDINTKPQILEINVTRETIIAMNATLKIKDVEILVPNKVVNVVFDDDTFEKAICHKDDEFDLERAITVCIAKRLLGGSSKYNNLVEKGIKVLKNKIKAEKEAKEEKEKIEAKRKKNHEKLMKRIAKREQEARDNRIQELAEAIKRASEMKNTEGK